MPDWELFTGRAKQSQADPMLSVQTRGNLAFNHKAYEDLDEPEALELLFDRKTRQIGLRKADPDLNHVYPVHKQPKSTSYFVAAQAFCKTYHIPMDRTRRYKGEVVDGMLIVDLKQQAIEPMIRSRGRKNEQSDAQ